MKAIIGALIIGIVMGLALAYYVLPMAGITRLF